MNGFEDMSDQEIKDAGVNDSMIHVDFMIGCKELNITGHTRDGRDIAIFKDGNWSI